MNKLSIFFALLFIIFLTYMYILNDPFVSCSKSCFKEPFSSASFLNVPSIHDIISNKIPENTRLTDPERLLSQVMNDNRYSDKKYIQELQLFPSDAFCLSTTPGSVDLDAKCNKLTPENCNTASCCVNTPEWKTKCVAGTVANGPTFLSNYTKTEGPLSYYYNLDKCYGNGCIK